MEAIESKVKLEISLYGGFDCRWSDGKFLKLNGAKQRALFAMLAVATRGVQSRNWLREHIWGRAGEELGRASLRRCLSDLRKNFGARFDNILEVNNIDIRLRLDQVALTTTPRNGEFLAGINVPEPMFQDWLNQHREKFTSHSILLDSDTRLAISPSVTILPFSGVTGAKMESHFGDLVALEVSRALSRSRLIDVISHCSSRKFGGVQLDLDKLQTSLNADYAIGGTVRVDDKHFRLDADFIQISTGRILWTQNFTGPLSDILNGHSEMVEQIAQKCGQEILREAVKTAHTRPLPEVASHALFMASVTGMHQHHLASFARSRDNLEELILRLPKFSNLHAWLAKWYILSIAQGWSTDVRKDSQIASDCTKRALDINPLCSTSLTIDGMIQGDRQEDMSTALLRFEAATEIDPNQALAWLMYSRMHSFQGEGELAIKFAQKARRLSPFDPHGYFYDIMTSVAHLANGDFDEARILADRSIKSNPRHTSSYRVLAIALQLSGHPQEARDAVTFLTQLDPRLTVSRYLSTHPAGKLPTGKIWASALKDAGLPA
ncbi:MAG: tetratricopeptide repeat protein [Rhodobacteraceae bacterium]|nr:tetratricopeptide repeat protein [Paracoccaceae bacterium]